ncbi:MADS-box protein AGL42 isoform X3 [Vigna radiata var. radiata]|uniref:MADS-box protein AGL42 isoform X3 n=1 Tax=Vigna radiata var. radiata TaxID=3916 RepID=A0A3Q0FG93_VIGRR|nr:MADS-box protein AGL42 isoform X3 [Vigna radiata var. radiata]
MVRGKVQMKKIEDATSRQVTFSKRRNGLLKKAYELSVLCDAQVAVIVFSQNGRLYEFSSSNMSKILERYREYTKDVPTNKFGDDYIQQLKLESANMAEKIQLLEISKRKLLGQSVSCCSYDELKEIEDQLQRSLLRVRQRKAQLYMEQIDQLRCQVQTFS